MKKYTIDKDFYDLLLYKSKNIVFNKTSLSREDVYGLINTIQLLVPLEQSKKDTSNLKFDIYTELTNQGFYNS